MSRGAIISLSINPAQMRDLQETLAGVRNGIPRVISGAQNKTIKTGESRIVKDLAKMINLPQGSPSAQRRDLKRGTSQKFIRDYISVKKSNQETLLAEIRFKRKGIPLFAYKPIQKKAGVSVKPRKDKPRQVLKNTFIATMGSGHRGIFERRRLGSKSSGPRHGRLPVDERYGPTILGVYEGSPGLAAALEAEIHTIYDKNLASQVDRVLQRRKLD